MTPLSKHHKDKRDGELDLGEMRSMFRRLLKLTAKQISDDQLILLFRDLDLDDSGTLAMEELFEMLENPNWMPPPPEAREAATEAAAAAEELEEERRLAEAEEQRVRAERSREEEERSRLEEEAAQVSLGPHFPTILPVTTQKKWTLQCLAAGSCSSAESTVSTSSESIVKWCDALRTTARVTHDRSRESFLPRSILPCGHATRDPATTLHAGSSRARSTRARPI